MNPTSPILENYLTVVPGLLDSTNLRFDENGVLLLVVRIVNTADGVKIETTPQLRDYSIEKLVGFFADHNDRLPENITYEFTFNTMNSKLVSVSIDGQVIKDPTKKAWAGVWIIRNVTGEDFNRLAMTLGAAVNSLPSVETITNLVSEEVRRHLVTCLQHRLYQEFADGVKTVWVITESRSSILSSAQLFGTPTMFKEEVWAESEKLMTGQADRADITIDTNTKPFQDATFTNLVMAVAEALLPGIVTHEQAGLNDEFERVFGVDITPKTEEVIRPTAAAGL